MAEPNLRALAKQSWDAIFAQAYPKLGAMIRSINEEMERTLEDSRREIKSTTLALEDIDQKLVSTKSNISNLVDSQDKINSYLSRIEWNPSTTKSGGGLDLTMPDLSKLKDKKNTKAEEKNKGKGQEEVKKSTADKLKTGTWSFAGKLVNIAFLGSLAYETYMYIYNLDPRDPDYAEKASVKISQAVALVGFIEFAAAISACIGSAIAPGVGTIIGALGGLAAGWFFKDEVDELTEYVVKKIFEYKKKLAGESSSASAVGPSGDISGGALSSMSSTDSIRFVADKIIFKSSQRSQQSQSSSTSSSGGSGEMTASKQPSIDTTPPAGSGFGQSSGQASKSSRSSSGMSSMGSSSGPTSSDQSENTPQDESQDATTAPATETKEKPKNVATQGADASKVDSNLLSSFYKAAEEFGQPVTITSGFRSDEKQAELYARWMAGEPNIYMPSKPVKAATVTIRGKAYNVPGGGSGSNHSKGTAIDSPQAEAMDRAGLLKKYGLVRPNAGDPVHIQLANGGEATEETQQAGSQVSSKPTTGAAVNKASVDKKVETEKQQQAASLEVNNLVSQSPSSQTPDQPQDTSRNSEVGVNNRLGRLIAQA
jgi:hypothetical protein